MSRTKKEVIEQDKNTKKIVLVRPNYDSHIITPPLGLGYLSAVLKKNGVDVKIIDALRDSLSLSETVQRILRENPDAVGITCLTSFYNEVVRLSLALKKKGIKVIIGGPHVTFLPYKTLLDSKADFVVCGEGEVSLVKLIKNNLSNKNIQGVYSLKDLKSEKTPILKSEFVQNLDELPFPDWEQLNPNKYPKAPHGAIAKNFPIGVIMTTRGCPYECSFCASPKLYDRKIRFRTPQNVVEEIKYLINKFGVKEIHFEDDNLTLKREHVEEICNLILKNKIKISWACPNGIRADRVDEELVKLMKKAGCYYFAYGVESANPQILKNIKKREGIDSIKKAITIADKEGISCQGFFIFGLPGENKDTINETINFARNSKLSRAQFLILDVLPGSQLWDDLKGEFVPDWNKNSYKEPEWIPKGLTKKDLMDAQSKAFRKFFFRPKIAIKLAKSVRPSQVRYLAKRLLEYGVIRDRKTK